MFDGELLSRKRKHNRHSECFRSHKNVRNVCRDCFLCRRLCARHYSSTVQEQYQRRSFVYEYYTPDGEEKSSKYIQMDRSERKIKQTVSHNAETADRDRVKNKETSNYTRKYAAPLARSSSVFGDFKKAESGPVQGATVNRRLVEPTNSASMDILYTSLGIVKKRLHLKKTRNENRKGEWLF